jgi:hypothetical protein
MATQKPLAERLAGLRASALARMASLVVPDGPATDEAIETVRLAVQAVRRRWRHFERRAVAEATLAGEAFLFIEDCKADPAYLHYEVIVRWLRDRRAVRRASQKRVVNAEYYERVLRASRSTEEARERLRLQRADRRARQRASRLNG